jgi:hypothetical protein
MDMQRIQALQQQLGRGGYGSPSSVPEIQNARQMGSNMSAYNRMPAIQALRQKLFGQGNKGGMTRPGPVTGGGFGGQAVQQPGQMGNKGGMTRPGPVVGGPIPGAQVAGQPIMAPLPQRPGEIVQAPGQQTAQLSPGVQALRQGLQSGFQRPLENLSPMPMVPSYMRR